MNSAFVKIWGVLVGAVARDERTGISTFEYEADFKKRNWDLSPLKMPIQSNKTIFSFPELKPDRNSPFDTYYACR
jgi:serine/threonine-protein kinase HipA